ncbi:hypothetical protein EVJ58_g9160 [Rhodofomes roseus]|uniref:Uncharacterized protein n=1 Tax=Rhodofomes roseus TaxID=34475 RepID=A0A4Y9XX21_9APHY|nr:hypothetical protein EVJ58_g9160 [Rhodofomes roseus]
MLPLLYAAFIAAASFLAYNVVPSTLYAGGHGDDWHFLLAPQASVERLLNFAIRRQLLSAEEPGDTVQYPLTEYAHILSLDPGPAPAIPDLTVGPALMSTNEDRSPVVLAFVAVLAFIIVVAFYMGRNSGRRSSRTTCEVEIKFNSSDHHPPQASHRTASISVSSNVPSLSLNINTGAQLGGQPLQTSGSSSSSARDVPLAPSLSNTAFGLPDAVPGLSAAAPGLSTAVPGLSGDLPSVASTRVSDGLLNTLHSLGVSQLATDPAEVDLTADSDPTPADDMPEVPDLSPDHTADVASPDSIPGSPATEGVPEAPPATEAVPEAPPATEAVPETPPATEAVPETPGAEDELGTAYVESDPGSCETCSDNLSSVSVDAAPETPSAEDQTGETDSDSWETVDDNLSSVFVDADHTSDLVSVDDAITSPEPSTPSSSSSLVDSPTTSRFPPVSLLPAGRRRVTVPVFPHGLFPASVPSAPPTPELCTLPSVEDPVRGANGQSSPSTPSADQGESDSWVLRAYMSADRKTADRSARLSLKFPLYRGEAVEYFRRSGQRLRLL